MRRYYNSTQEVYNLLSKHPSLSQMLDEFGIGEQGIKEVSEFLYNNDEKLQNFDLHSLYDWETKETLEPDQPSPNALYINRFNQLSTSENIDYDRTYYVIENDTYYHYKFENWFMEVDEPDAEIYEVEKYSDMSEEPVIDRYYHVIESDKYYQYKEPGWYENKNFKTFTRDEYKKYQQETGFLIWEYERGYFIFVEQEDGTGKWEEIGESNEVEGSVIRKSDLPDDGVEFGDIYEVRGEDILDVIAVLYGFTPPEYGPPWLTYESTQGTNLLEMLKFTLYYYRYATVDNFYEEHIFDFIPEYDRNYILSKPKMKLFMQGIGRSLDNLEDKISRIPDLYNLDKVPDELLDYVGQLLGYEREDFTLASLSFRELLKNIVEIYKIKGTNYSFSFFFKFLGFNVNLKEFYFNRDVENPESFPGIDEKKVEYYLTTINPIFDTTNNNPANHLDQIRNLNEWEYEYNALEEAGCQNVLNYMMGKESYNNNNEKWHSNPWRYFKSNLIEYQLDPFMDKINLTASDNETIRKYIKFLSPTYLFTWVNVNLKPWVDTYDVHTEIEEKLNIDIQKSMGDYVDPETGSIYLYNTMQNSLEKIRDNNYIFQDYEDMTRYLDLYEEEAYYEWNGNKWEKLEKPTTAKGHLSFYRELPTSPSEGDVYHIRGGEIIQSSIVLNNPIYGDINNPNYTGHDSSDKVGTVLRRDGTHVRQRNHPNYIDNMKHNGMINLGFDNLSIYIKDYNSSNWNYTVQSVHDLPMSVPINSLALVTNKDTVYIYKEEDNYWEEFYMPNHEIVVGEVETENDLPSTQQELEEVSQGDVYYVVSTDTYKEMIGLEVLWKNFDIFNETYNGEKIIKGTVAFKSHLMTQTNVANNDIYYVNSDGRFYKYVITEPAWEIATATERFINWNDYSFRPFPDVPTEVIPYSGTTIYTNNPILSWNNVADHDGFCLEMSFNLDFGKDDGIPKQVDGIPDNENIILEEILPKTQTSLQVNNLSNNNYYWRVRTKNSLGEYGEWSNIFSFTVDALPYPFDGEKLDRETDNVAPVYDGGELINININFQWEEIPYIDHYVIDISPTGEFINILYREETDQNSIQIRLPNNETYYWRIQAFSGEEVVGQVGPSLFKTRF